MADTKVSVSLSAREKFCLAAHMLTNIVPKNHEEGIRYYDSFQQCDLEQYRLTLTKKELFAKADVNEMSNTADMDVSLANSTVTYLLEVLNQPMSGLHTLTLVPLAFRLRNAQVESTKNK